MLSQLLRQYRWSLLACCYLISYGFMLLLGNARFWDDWASHSFRGVNFQSGQTFPFRETLDEFTISTFGGFWMHRPLTMLAFGVCGFAVWGILGVPRTWLQSRDRFWITALFLLLPFNSVRATVHVLFSYTFSHLAFFMAWYVLVSRRQWWWFLLAMSGFLLSFPTNSLLFFVVAPAIHSLFNFQIRLPIRLLRFLVIGLSSVFYRSISARIWPSLRFNDGYNEITSSFLLRAVVIFISINLFSLVMAQPRLWSGSDVRGRRLIAIGLTIFSLGLFPYMAVGHFPNLSDFMILFVPNLTEMDSRHSLLLPLGTAMTIVGGVKMLCRHRYQNASLGVLLVCCTLLNASIYSQYYTDSVKQRAIVHSFEKGEAPISTRAVEFRDEAARFNARGRSLYHWEYLGLLQEAGRGLDFEIMDRGQYPCEQKLLVKGTLVRISSSAGRLRTILTGNAGIKLSSEMAFLCGPGMTPLEVRGLQP